MNNKFYKSKIIGKSYSANEYINHGYGGIMYGKKDLPHNEYPYEIIYETQKKYIRRQYLK
jgi:hypothetical protein